MKTIECALLLAGAVVTSGCATNQYDSYAKAHESASSARIAESTAKAKAESDRYLAMASIARNATESVKSMAMMALALGGQAAGGVQQTASPAIAAPVNETLEWAKLLVPAATQVSSIWAGVKLGVVQSNNALAAKQSDNAMVTTISTTGTNAVAGTAGAAFGVLGGVANEAVNGLAK